MYNWICITFDSTCRESKFEWLKKDEWNHEVKSGTMRCEIFDADNTGISKDFILWKWFRAFLLFHGLEFNEHILPVMRVSLIFINIYSLKYLHSLPFNLRSLKPDSDILSLKMKYLKSYENEYGCTLIIMMKLPSPESDCWIIWSHMIFFDFRWWPLPSDLICRAATLRAQS